MDTKEDSNKDKNHKQTFWATWSQMYLQHTQMYLQIYSQNKERVQFVRNF